MNYQNFSDYSNVPPEYGRVDQPFYDRGQGIPQLNQNNMTIQDIFRTPFLFIQEHHQNYVDQAPVALKGIQSESELSKLFFSDENIKRVQRMIKKEIYTRTNGEFKLEADQDVQDLFILMRAIFLENARFLPNEIVRQVKRLNQKVVSESVPGIITNIRQEYGYLREINKPLSPIARPQNVNRAGRNALPSVFTTFE